MRAGVATGQALRRRPRGRANFAVAARDWIPVRIDLGVAHRRRQAIGVGRCQSMLGPFRPGMDLAHRHTQFVGQIELPEPVGADDVQRETLALTGQSEVVALGADQALALKPLHERQQLRSLVRRTPCRARTAARLARGGLAEQMLQRVFRLLPVRARRPVAPARQAKPPWGPERQRQTTASTTIAERRLALVIEAAMRANFDYTKLNHDSTQNVKACAEKSGKLMILRCFRPAPSRTT